jgi:hypothetical protein
MIFPNGIIPAGTRLVFGEPIYLYVDIEKKSQVLPEPMEERAYRLAAWFNRKFRR